MATFDNTQSLSGQVGFGGNTAGPANEDPALEAFGGGRGNRATEGIIGDYALEQQGYTRPIRNTVTGQITNPYPDSFFSRVFGAENVDYTNILGDQMGNVENARRARFFNTGAVSKGFGSLFGGAEGEMTVAGPRVAQIQPATTGQSLAGIVGMALGLPVGALSRAARTTYAPEGYLNKDFDSPSALSATSEIATGISPEAVGSMYDQAKEGIRSFFTDNDVDGVMDNLERPMDKYAGQRGRDFTADQITPAGLTADYDTIAAGSPPNVSMTATSALELPSAMEQGPPQLVLGKPLESEILGGFEANDFLDYPGLDRDTRFRTTLTGSGAYTPTLQELMESRLRNAKRAQQ